MDDGKSQPFRVNPESGSLVIFVSGVIIGMLCMLVLGFLFWPTDVNQSVVQDSALIPLHTERTFLESERNLTRLPWPPARLEPEIPRSPMFMRGYYEYLAND